MLWPGWTIVSRKNNNGLPAKSLHLVMGSDDLLGFINRSSSNVVVVTDRNVSWDFGAAGVTTEYLPSPPTLARFGTSVEVASYLRGRLDTLKFKWNATTVHAIGSDARAFLEFVYSKNEKGRVEADATNVAGDQ